MDEYYGNDQGQQARPVAAEARVYDENKRVMGTGEWLITMIVLCIPLVGFIMYFVWAFGDGNENRKNYCRAGLIILAIGVVLTIVLMMMFGAALAVMMSSYS